MKKTALFLCFFLGLSMFLPAKSKNTVLRGYITEIVSASTFKVGDVQVTFSPNLAVDLVGGSNRHEK